MTEISDLHWRYHLGNKADKGINFFMQLCLKIISDLQSRHKIVLINPFALPIFCLYFAFTGINFRDMLHNACDVLMTKAWVDQSELVNVEAQID